MIEYSNYGYLDRNVIREIGRNFKDFNGNAFRFWSLDFCAKYIVKDEATLDVVCGKNQLGPYLRSKGYNIFGIDGGVSNFTRPTKTQRIVYKGFPIMVAPHMPPMPYDDNSFDCCVLIDVWRWLHPGQKHSASEFTIFTKGNSNICQGRYLEIIKEVCRITRKKIIIVERVYIQPDLPFEFGRAMDIMKGNNFHIGQLGRGPMDTFLMMDKAIQKPREFESRRATYFGIGMIATKET